MRFLASLAVVAICLSSASAQRPITQEGFVRTHDGLKLAYKVMGSGPRAIAIPLGFILERDFARLASADRTLIFYDQRNRGRSEAIAPEKLSIHDEVRDMETLRQHFRLEKLTPVGYSYLGLMVMLYALEHPDRVQDIVQLGPVPMRFDTEYPPHLRSDDREAVIGKERLAELNRLVSEGFHERQPEEYCRRQWEVTRVALVGDPAHVAALGSGFCDLPNEWPVAFAKMWPHRQEEMRQLRVTRERLSRITQRVLTIHGTKDRNAPYGSGREWAATLPNARLVTVRGGAHQSWADDPERVFGAIEQFLQGKWPESAERITNH